MTANYETREHDVLIIGAGGAGLRAAIEALAQGASVGVVCKSLLGKAHTVMAEGGIAAAMANVDTADNWKTHFRDTMRGGKFLNNWRMAQLHAQESPDRVRELEQWGALFDRTETGDILQRAFGGHTFKRLCHVGDRTGLEMIRTLQDRGVQQGIDVYMECTVTRLLTNGGRVAGAFAYWRESGRLIVFKAKSIVIATGGIGKAWRITSNSWEYTGDGMALAYEAGAELMDMEFVQFHPTGMVWPPGVQGILVTEAVRGEGGILRNKLGERFMEKYDPKRMELSTRDVVVRSIDTEVKEGRGTEHGGAYLDISQKPAEYVKKKLPSMYHQFKELADVDIAMDSPWIPFAPADAHREYLALLSYLPLNKFSAVPGFFRFLFQIQKQLRSTPGVIGYSLRAKILSRNFWTLSVWENQKALMEFVAKIPHGEAMKAMTPHMGPTKFTQWKVAGSSLPLNWDEAMQRSQPGAPS